MKRALAWALLGLSLASCAKRLRPDAVPPAKPSGYPTAEFYACGKRWHGLGVCSLEMGKPLSDLGFSVQGYYKGTIELAWNCGPQLSSVRYDQSQKVPVALQGQASVSCGITIVVSPEYPKEYESAIKIESLVGQLYVRVVPAGTVSEGQITKAPVLAEPSLEEIEIDVGEGPAQAMFYGEGCDVHFGPSDVPVENGKVRIKLGDVWPHLEKKVCVIEGVIFPKSGAKRVSWLVAGYDKGFIPLPVPTTKKDKDCVKIDGDPNVSIVTFDDKAEIDNSAHFKCRPGHHVSRLLTVGGRTEIGETDDCENWRWTR